MGKDLNQCNFIGRIGKDLELKYMPSGNAVVNFSIACGDDYKKDGQKIEQTNWINIVAFGKLAEIINEYCAKGSRVFISGKQQTKKWQDQNGSDRYTTEIIANQVQMLDSRNDSSSQNFGAQNSQTEIDSESQSNQQPDSEETNLDFDDDIPF